MQNQIVRPCIHHINTGATLHEQQTLRAAMLMGAAERRGDGLGRREQQGHCTRIKLTDLDEGLFMIKWWCNDSVRDGSLPSQAGRERGRSCVRGR